MDAGQSRPGIGDDLVLLGDARPGACDEVPQAPQVKCGSSHAYRPVAFEETPHGYLENDRQDGQLREADFSAAA